MAVLQIRFKQTWGILRDQHFVKQMVWVAGFWVVTVAIIFVNIQFLINTYPDPVRPDDLILDLIPESSAFIAIGDFFTMSLFALSIFYFGIWQGGVRELPKLLFLLAMMYIIRAFVINLTPLAQIQPPSENFHESHVIAQTFYHGMFFSGHTASAFIQAFFFKGYRHQWVLFVLATGAAFSLIASHSHYTIDIVGGFFAAYFVVHFNWLSLLPESLRRAKWAPWHAEEAANPAKTAI